MCVTCSFLPALWASAVFLIGSCPEWSVALLTRRGDWPVSPSGWNLAAGDSWQQPHLHRVPRAPDPLSLRGVIWKHQKPWQPTRDPHMTSFRSHPSWWQHQEVSFQILLRLFIFFSPLQPWKLFSKSRFFHRTPREEADQREMVVGQEWAGSMTHTCCTQGSRRLGSSVCSWGSWEHTLRTAVPAKRLFESCDFVFLGLIWVTFKICLPGFPPQWLTEW